MAGRMHWLIAALCLSMPCLGQAADLPAPAQGFVTPDPASVRLGWHLFYDPILSGNKTVSCASCHHPRLGTSDGVSLGLGDGGLGLGLDRKISETENTPEQRVPRNAPGLFNLGFAEFSSLFHDGRLEADTTRPSGLRTPLDEDMVTGFASPLSAQTMFPVLSPDEMAGHYNENDVSRAVRMGLLAQPGGAWDILAARVADIPAYRAGFDAVIGSDEPIHFTDISNAMADFIAAEWRADDSPFDRFLRDGTALPAPATRGMNLFYGDAGCSTCHSGPFQTDQQFHAIAMPQIGPGKAARFESHHRDTGRARVTGRAEDAYRFRTPSLRNVTQTAPYGHAGAYARLEDVVRHHLDPVAALQAYDIGQAVLPELPGAKDSQALNDPAELAAIAAANELAPISLTDAEIADVLAFLASLEDETSLTGRLGVPATVPSGLPVDQ